MANFIKDAARHAGVAGDIGGHSLRSGFIPAAMEAGVQERQIMHQTGQRSIEVLRSYQQRKDALCCDNAAEKLL